MHVCVIGQAIYFFDVPTNFKKIYTYMYIYFTFFKSCLAQKGNVQMQLQSQVFAWNLNILSTIIFYYYYSQF